jgi:hypothetical protein
MCISFRLSHVLSHTGYPMSHLLLGYISYTDKQRFTHHITSTTNLLSPKEYRMIYRGPDFLAVVYLALLLPPPTPYPVGKLSLSQSFCVSPVELTDRRWGKGVQEEPNHTTARKHGSL